MAVSEPSSCSGLKTADAVIYSKQATLTGIQLTPAAADATLTIYDNPSAASGTVLWKGKLLASSAGEYFHMPDGGIEALTGLYADIDGAAAEYIVHYRALR
jgi:hypothetical protein